MNKDSANTQVIYEQVNEIGVITIDAPPVNALSEAVIAGLIQGVLAFEADRSAKALVIGCNGRTFVAGADIKYFEHEDFSATAFNQMLLRLENQKRPVVAALHGHVLGGGLELAMACHARIALPNTRLGLPEITLGLLPGSLGTQRLPRLIPLDAALDMMLSGQPISAEQALSLGLIDAVQMGASGLEVGLAFARSVLVGTQEVKQTRFQPARSEGLSADYFEKKLAEVSQKQQAYPAARAIVESVQATATEGFEAGERVEAHHFDACRHSRQSRAMRHLFFAEREAGHIPDLAGIKVLRDIRKVGVIGAGTMGCGIAMNFANIGIPTVLLEVQPEALERGMNIIRQNYQNTVDKGRLTAQAMEKRMHCLSGVLNYADLSDCDLVIEAVFEDLSLKQQIMKSLGEVCKPGAIMATNTSTLNVDVIAAASGRAQDVVGMHFFSPANVMRLLEVVRGEATSQDVLATVMALARRIGKVAVVSGVCYGFIGNRMLEPYLRESEFLLMEGASPAQIDAAVERIEHVGMAMGPCRMLDMAGVDVGAKTLIELGKAGSLPSDPSYRPVCQALHAEGRAGQKTATGYYRYEGRTRFDEPKTEAICVQLAQKYGITRRDHITNEEIVERLLLPLINEGAKILEEGIALRASDIDVVWVAGYGFPNHQGGPLWMADQWGLSKVVERIEHYAKLTGNAFGYWTVSPLLKQLAAQNVRISDWVKHG